MLLYLLLIIACALLALISLGAFVFGLIKKQKNIIIGTLFVFIISMIGCIFFALAYSKKVYNYVKGNEFQKDVRKGSEIVGKTVGSVSSGLTEGLAGTLDDRSIDSLARKSATILGHSLKTIASGLDSTIGNKNIFIAKSLAGTGIELGRAEEQYSAGTNNVGIFINYKKDFKGKLRLVNYDQTGRKIDIAERKIDVKAGLEKVEVFSFKYSDLGMTTYYIISKED